MERAHHCCVVGLMVIESRDSRNMLRWRIVWWRSLSGQAIAVTSSYCFHAAWLEISDVRDVSNVSAGRWFVIEALRSSGRPAAVYLCPGNKGCDVSLDEAGARTATVYPVHPCRPSRCRDTTALGPSTAHTQLFLVAIHKRRRQI